jgi:hypothetical protein
MIDRSGIGCRCGAAAVLWRRAGALASCDLLQAATASGLQKYCQAG